MKIEKINKDKIRCILNKDELVSRHIEVSNLKYGSSEAKALFKDIMDKAFNELGFDLSGKPLMIEAIPMAGDEIMLILTKIKGKDAESNLKNDLDLEHHTFEKATENTINNVNTNSKSSSNGEYTICLDSFNDVVLLSKNLNEYTIDDDALFFDKKENLYYLYLKLNKKEENIDFNQIIGNISEFSYEPIKNYGFNFLNENYTLIERKNVIEHCKTF